MAARVHIKDKRGGFPCFYHFLTSLRPHCHLFRSPSDARTHVRSRPVFMVTGKIIKHEMQIMSSTLIGSYFHS